MDIKSVIKQIQPFTSAQRKDVVSKDTKLENQTERDADGRSGERSEPQARRLNDGEVEKVLKAISSLPGFKDNQLQVVEALENDQHIFRILDPQGKVVRRLTERDASRLLKSPDPMKGQIFRKAL